MVGVLVFSPWKMGISSLPIAKMGIYRDSTISGPGWMVARYIMVYHGSIVGISGVYHGCTSHKHLESFGGSSHLDPWNVLSHRGYHDNPAD